MTTSAPAAPLVSLPAGAEPRFCKIPPYVSSAGAEAIELAEIAGLNLDPWQAFVLAHSLGERPDGKWAAFEVGVEVSRQNGKGSVIEARELAGLFVLDERLLIHSAHQFDTSLEAFRRLLFLIEDTPELDRRVQRVSKSHGEEGIELKKNPKTGLRQRIRFRTRTKGGGRGFTGDLLVLDEAMILPESAHGALLPTLSARPNPQVWYTGSAVDQEEHEHGIVFARLRQRALEGDDDALMYCEWSADVKRWLEAHGLRFHPERGELEQITPALLADPEMWAQGNPGLGIRITTEHVEKERGAMGARKFAVERLGIGDWPDISGESDRVISSETWLACAGEAGEAASITGRKFFAIDVNPDRTWGAIAHSGRREDDLFHVELVEHERGTEWIVDRCVELQKAHRGCKFVIDTRSPAAALIDPLKVAKIRLIEASTQDYGNACGGFFDAVAQQRIRYPVPQLELDDALADARKAPMGDAWKWSRKNSTSADISPLVACTLALWAAQTRGGRRARVINLGAALQDEPSRGS